LPLRYSLTCIYYFFSISSFLCSVCHFVLFLLTIVFSVLLWFTDFDYLFVVFRPLLGLIIIILFRNCEFQ
jgi:hypothetical protein